MTTLHDLTFRLPLHTGSEVEAFVQHAHGRARASCLLLHGNPGSLLDWTELVPRLSDALDVAAFDLPGFGRSRRRSFAAESMSLAQLAEHVLAAAEALELRAPLLLVGHSHGGGIAQIVAANYPERVAGLVLIGTLGSPAHGSYRLLSMPGARHVVSAAARAFRTRRLRAVNHWLLERVMRDIFAPEAVPAEKVEKELAVLTMHPEILLSMVQVTLGAPSQTLLEAAKRIRCPTLFVHGERDALVPPKHARSIHERIVQAGGRSRFELIPGAGHMLLEQRAQEIAALLLDALPFVTDGSR